MVSPPIYDDPKALPGEMEGLEDSQTHRGLSSRHVQFLALGGCIGTGLFVGSGQTLSTVGPGKHLFISNIVGNVWGKARQMHAM